MRKIRIFATLAVVFFLFILPLTPVFAQETPKKVFARMDTNQDGKVTEEEFMTFYVEYAEKLRQARFDKLDTNKDGMISREEFMAVQVAEAKKIGKLRFRRIDVNKNGEITEAELTKRFGAVKQSLQQLKSQ